MKIAPVAILLAALCENGRALTVARFEPISAARLNELERKFAGDGTSATTNVGRHEIGGDRMSPNGHNYGPTYAKYLNKLAISRQLPPEVDPPTIVEVGILKGSGLAMWEGLFPKSRIHGFDIDTSVYLNNVAHLKTLGFNGANVQVHSMDQMKSNSRLISEKLGTAKASIVIDDGLHTHEAAQTTFVGMLPFLADKFAYFLQDIIDPMPVAAYIRSACRTCQIEVSQSSKLHSEYLIIISRF